jgi:hypothetical protein
MGFSRLKETSALIAGGGFFLANRLLLQLGLRRRLDGWRCGAGLLLRGEAATFVLSTFGLDVWSDAAMPASVTVEATQAHCAERLAKFLAGETASHIHIKRGELHDHPEACSGPSYTLDFQSSVDGLDRFIRPDSWTGKDCSTSPPPSTSVLLNIVARIRPGGVADLWMRVNHIGMDGVPAQEILARLEAAWGLSENVVYPTPQVFSNHCGPRPCCGRDELVEMQVFIDFAPLLHWRKTENARLPQPMTLAAAIMWCLARHPAFADLRIGTTVELPAAGSIGRGVGVLVIRPADYFHRQDGLTHYVREFNRQLELTRRRSSSGYKALEAAALMPPTLSTTLLRRALQSPRAFGSTGLTILRDAKVFGAPMGDIGHAHGFIALGSISLPTSTDRKVGCITIKGPPANISNYPTAIQEAIQRCADGLTAQPK